MAERRGSERRAAMTKLTQVMGHVHQFAVLKFRELRCPVHGWQGHLGFNWASVSCVGGALAQRTVDSVSKSVSVSSVSNGTAIRADYFIALIRSVDT